MQYNVNNPAVKRILREVKEMEAEPSDQYHANPLEDNIFEWHFTIRGPKDTEFEGGLYHGRIILPPEYPFKPPNIVLLNESGRFEVGTKICLSISSYHPEHWQPSWTIKTMLVALISFLPSKGDGAIGAIDMPAKDRQFLALKTPSFLCNKCGKRMCDILAPVEVGAKTEITSSSEEPANTTTTTTTTTTSPTESTPPSDPTTPAISTTTSFSTSTSTSTSTPTPLTNNTSSNLQTELPSNLQPPVIPQRAAVSPASIPQPAAVSPASIPQHATTSPASIPQRATASPASIPQPATASPTPIPQPAAVSAPIPQPTFQSPTQRIPATTQPVATTATLPLPQQYTTNQNQRATVTNVNVGVHNSSSGTANLDYIIVALVIAIIGLLAKKFYGL